MFIVFEVQESRYLSSLLECNLFVKNMKPDETFFEELTEPKGILIKALADTCPSKIVEIRNRNVEPLAQLSKDCYYKMANGRDIMAAKSYEKSICVFCGFAKAEDDISDLDSKLEEIYDNEEYKDLFKEGETSNLNSVTLSEEALSELSVSEEENLMVYYFIYRLPNDPDYQTGISRFASRHGGFLIRNINYFLSESATDSVSSVVIQKWRSENEEFEIVNESFPSLAESYSDEIDLGCGNFVIPTKHYD